MASLVARSALTNVVNLKEFDIYVNLEPIHSLITTIKLWFNPLVISFMQHRSRVEGLARKWSPGLVNFVPAVACHFCLNLLTQPDDFF